MLPIGPLITSVAAAAPGSFSSATTLTSVLFFPRCTPQASSCCSAGLRTPSALSEAPSSALHRGFSLLLALPVASLGAEALTCKAPAEVHQLWRACRFVCLRRFSLVLSPSNKHTGCVGWFQIKHHFRLEALQIIKLHIVYYPVVSLQCLIVRVCSFEY